jgi:hypothetical protein
MSLSKAIYKILSSETDLIAETSTRIFPSVIPQNVDYPALMYEINSQDPIYVKDRRHQKTEAHIVIGVHGKTYADVQNVSDIVIATLEKYKDATDYSNPETGISGTPDTGGCSIVEGYWIQEIFFDNSFDLFDEKLRVFEKYIEFDVRFLNNPSSMGAYGWFPVDIKGLMSTSETASPPTPPTSNSDKVRLWYDGSGATTLNVSSGDSSAPYYNTGGYLKFQEADGSGASISSASAIEFTNGCTLFFVFQEDVTASDFYLYLTSEGSSGNENQIYFRRESTASQSFIYIRLNGTQKILKGGISTPDFSNKCYLAISWGNSSDENGEWELIDPNDSTYFNKNFYNSYSQAGGGNFKFQNFGIGADGTDSSLRLYESVIFNKKLTFGGGQYNRIKDYLLNKHSL